jgi:hypothetical protein
VEARRAVMRAVTAEHSQLVALIDCLSERGLLTHLGDMPMATRWRQPYGRELPATKALNRLRRFHMANTPRQPKTTPGSQAGLKDGEGAPPPQGDPEVSGGKRPLEDEDVFGGLERTHRGRVASDKAKP